MNDRTRNICGERLKSDWRCHHKPSVLLGDSYKWSCDFTSGFRKNREKIQFSPSLWLLSQLQRGDSWKLKIELLSRRLHALSVTWSDVSKWVSSPPQCCCCCCQVVSWSLHCSPILAGVSIHLCSTPTLYLPPLSSGATSTRLLIEPKHMPPGYVT